MPNTSHTYGEGDKVRLEGTNLTGVVISVGVDGDVCVKTDSGITMQARAGMLALIEKPSSRPLHDEHGRFAPGHPKVGGLKKGTKNVRYYRTKLIEQLAPFIDSMGEIIDQIDEPGEKILAISRIMKYAIPSLSSVDFKENVQRDLTAEQKIAQLNARFKGEPDPVVGPEEEE